MTVNVNNETPSVTLGALSLQMFIVEQTLLCKIRLTDSSTHLSREKRAELEHSKQAWNLNPELMSVRRRVIGRTDFRVL